MARKAIKVFVEESSHDLLHRYKDLTGETISDTVDGLVRDVLAEELEELEAKESVDPGEPAL